MGKSGSVAFGAWLRGRIGARSYGHLATYVGVSTSTVSRWVTGESAPEYRNRLKLAEYLDASIEEIDEFFPSGALLHQSPPVSGIEVPEGPPTRALAALARPALLYLGPHGWSDGVDGLTEAEAASVLASIAAFRARRASGGSADAGSGPPGAGGPR